MMQSFGGCITGRACPDALHVAERPDRSMYVRTEALEDIAEVDRNATLAVRVHANGDGFHSVLLRWKWYAASGLASARVASWGDSGVERSRKAGR